MLRVDAVVKSKWFGGSDERRELKKIRERESEQAKMKERNKQKQKRKKYQWFVGLPASQKSREYEIGLAQVVTIYEQSI